MIVQPRAVLKYRHNESRRINLTVVQMQQLEIPNKLKITIVEQKLKNVKKCGSTK